MRTLQFVYYQLIMQKSTYPVRFLGRAKVQILLYKQHPVKIIFADFQALSGFRTATPSFFPGFGAKIRTGGLK
jgi:hypothetical protein